MGVEIGVQVLLVTALAVWLLQERPLGYAPEWSLRVHGPWPPARLWRVLGLAASLGGGVGYLTYLLNRTTSERTARRLALAALLLLWLLAVGLQAQLHGLADFAGPWVVASTWSTVGTEYFRAAYEIEGLGAFLQGYPRHMQQAQYHVATHPPGAVLFYWLGIRLLAKWPGLQDSLTHLAEKWSGGSTAEIIRFTQQFPSAAHLPHAAIPATIFCTFLLMGVGSSVVVPVYLLARWEMDRPTALLAAACFCTVPSFLLFFQSLDQLVLVLATWTVYFFLLAAKREQIWLFLVAGIAWGLTLFVSLGAVVLGALLALFLAGLAWQQRRLTLTPLLPYAGGVAVFLVGAVAWWTLAALVGHFPPLETIRQGLAAHARVTTMEFPRTYSIWVWLNWVDWAIFLGLPLSVWWMRSLWAALTSAGCRVSRDENPESTPLVTRHSSLCPAWLNLALIGTLLLLDLSGQVRAEVGRIWLFLMPLAVVGLVHRLREQEVWLAPRLAVGLTLQFGQVCLMALTMTPLVLPY